jgi:hypothetical protein
MMKTIRSNVAGSWWTVFLDYGLCFTGCGFHLIGHDFLFQGQGVDFSGQSAMALP